MPGTCKQHGAHNLLCDLRRNLIINAKKIHDGDPMHCNEISYPLYCVFCYNHTETITNN